MNVCLFGETRVEADDRRLVARQLGGVKSRLLLECLAVHAGQPVSKSRLVEVLWPDNPPAGAIATMETYVSLLRRILQPGTPSRESVIRTVSGGYCLDADRVFVDLSAFLALAERASDDTSRAGTEAITEALRLVNGELLASDATVPWVDAVRSEFLATLAQACTDAARHAVARADFAAVITLGRRTLDIDPFREEAARHLMTALWRTGRRSEALREYDRLRGTLIEDLGVEPATETRDLHLAILLDDERGPATRDQDDEDSLVLELVRQVRLMVRERGIQESRDFVANLALGAA